MPTDFVLCDVFSERPFTGNPLAVFLDAVDIDDDRMFALAREFGWSEITFVLPQDGEAPFRVRIWTPGGELSFAGHPTVGTAVVLAATGRTHPGLSILGLGIGPVAVEVDLEDGNNGSATMTQREPVFGPVVEDRQGMSAAFGLSVDDLVPELPIQIVSTGLEHLLIPIRSGEALSRATPRHDEFAAIFAELSVRWGYLFCAETPGSAAAARARLLSPGLEDAATGSAAGPLGAYLVRYGLHRAGTLEIEQGIEMGRPSRIEVTVPVEDGEIGAVRVRGDVRIWGRGTLV